MMKAKYKNNIEKILQFLVKEYQMQVTKNTISRVVKEHPNKNSLGSISDILNEWNMATLGVKIRGEHISEIAFPAIAHCSQEEDSYFALVLEFKNNQVTYYDSDHGIITKNLDEFSQEWKGTMLLLEFKEGLGEPDFKPKRKDERFQRIELYTALVGIAFLLSTCILFGGSISIQLLMVAKLLGLGTSMLLFAQEFGFKDEIIDRLCNINKGTNCNAVLQSKWPRFLITGAGQKSESFISGEALPRWGWQSCTPPMLE